MVAGWVQRVIILASGLCICAVLQAADWNGLGKWKSEALNRKPNYFSGFELYRSCTVCHDKQGWGRRDGSFPQLSGQHFNVLVKQLTDMRDNNRENPSCRYVMHEVVDETQELADLASYISKLPMSPANGKGNGKDLERGERLYMEKCIGCHGDSGEGDNKRFYPRVHGQHYRYMLRQFNWIKAGDRLNSHPDMVIRIDHFTPQDAAAVVDYVSRLNPPKEIVAPSRRWRNPDFD